MKGVAGKSKTAEYKKKSQQNWSTHFHTLYGDEGKRTNIAE